jgi:hypothetical protein
MCLSHYGRRLLAGTVEELPHLSAPAGSVVLRYLSDLAGNWLRSVQVHEPEFLGHSLRELLRAD